MKRPAPRTHRSTATLAASAFLIAGAASPALAQEQAEHVQVLRVYDARDLGAYSDQSGLLMLRPSLRTNADGEGYVEIAADVERLPTSDVLLEIAGVSGLAASRLTDGIYLVTGEESAHEQLTAALGSYRAINGERYVVRIDAISMAADETPMPGQPAPGSGGTTLFRSHQTVNARSESVVQATTTEQYVSGWVPVVGTQAVGYQIQFDTAEEGFSGTLVIGAGESADGTVNVQLAGWVLDSEIHSTTIKLAGDELPLSTVSRRERGIQSSIAAPLGQRVVIASVSGFEPDTVIIVSAVITPAPSK